MSIRPLGRYPVICVEPVAAVSWRRVAKRAFDVVGAAALLLLASPVIAVAALAIRLTSGPGVLFRQQRVGRDGELFTVYKLRTMVQDAEDRLAELRRPQRGRGAHVQDGRRPRVTPVGRFLRKTSIDELPQLLNVLLGDMSLVGPRPALPREAEQWNDALRERLRVQPGITGMWQVSGRYTTSLEDYARLDLYYVDNWSLVTDLAILAQDAGRGRPRPRWRLNPPRRPHPGSGGVSRRGTWSRASARRRGPLPVLPRRPVRTAPGSSAPRSGPSPAPPCPGW